jgi:dethiobiotin synthetase
MEATKHHGDSAHQASAQTRTDHHILATHTHQQTSPYCLKPLISAVLKGMQKSSSDFVAARRTTNRSAKYLVVEATGAWRIRLALVLLGE